MNEIWARLGQHRKQTGGRRIIDLFEDERRFEDFSAEADGMLLDISKTDVDREALALLIELAEAAGLEERRDAMFAGAVVNESEERAALHTALRAPDGPPVHVDGEDVKPGVAATLARMEAFARQVRSGAVTGATGAPFADVVNIGIGGSDLGPAMATQALAPYRDGPRAHFVSNVDSAHLTDTLSGLDPATTLFIIASKTFTTVETMTHARAALAWLRRGVGDDVEAHLAAVSTAHDETAKIGVPADRVFGFTDWVGGRYSLWGPVGLSIMLAVGPDDFRAFLSGGRAMDEHFRTADLSRNLPVLLGLTGVWQRNICEHPTRAILPYDQRLARLPAYLQQLDMESNGKRVSADGAPLERGAGPVVWGEPGTNGQHAFHQLLHQGTDIVPTEFLIAAEGHEPELSEHHELLIANCLAQSEALMRGRSIEEARAIIEAADVAPEKREALAAQRAFPGDRPSTTIAYERLTPLALGQIIALYEHRVFVEGTIWGINSFDQWGVELGKELSSALLPMVRGASADDKDPSTRGLLKKLAKPAST